MTIEDLATVATDNESFSKDGEVLIQDKEGSFYVPTGCRYDEQEKRLVIEL